MASYKYSTSNGHALPAMTNTYDVAGSAHDWEDEKRRSKSKSIIYDDGTMTFFWRAHRITVLALFVVIIVYVGLFEERIMDPQYNIKRGVIAVVLAFVLFGVTHMPDGPFIRPHPVLWRFTMIISIVYLMAIIFLLFQDVDHARQMLKELDPKLGVPLPEKSYGGNCLLYDSGNPADPFHNVWDKFDMFVPVHFFGWWAKTMILRDWWLSMVMSIMFEVIEYTLEHQLPNFRECWWDHLIMDIIICNGIGIFLGMKTLNYLSIKTYNWQGMWNIPTYRGKVMRCIKQFTPQSWTDFDWSPTNSIIRWFWVLAMIAMFEVIELNTFYLKYILWLPPSHYLCTARLLMFLFWGAMGSREFFQYLDDPKCKKFGTQSWICCVITVTECILVLKWDWDLVTTPVPRHMTIFWGVFLTALTLYTIWHFYIQRLLWHTEFKLNNGRKKLLLKQEHSASNGFSSGKASGIENNNTDHKSESQSYSRSPAKSSANKRKNTSKQK